MNLDEIERLANAATPGPRFVSKYGSVFTGDTAARGYAVVEAGTDIVDRDFIAAARTAVPELIALVRKQEAELAEVRRVPATGKEPLQVTPAGPMSEHNARFAIDGAIQYGRENRNKPPSDDHWLMEYWLIGQQLAELGKTGWDNRTPLDPAERRVHAQPSAPAVAAQPIDMLLFCPACAVQHIDAPDERTAGWDNPPHRSHLCHACKYIWRPADVPTSGVVAIKTKGGADSPAVAAQAMRPATKGRVPHAFSCKNALPNSYHANCNEYCGNASTCTSSEFNRERVRAANGIIETQERSQGIPWLIANGYIDAPAAPAPAPQDSERDAARLDFVIKNDAFS